MTEYFTRRRVGIATLLIALLAWWLWPDRQLQQVRELQRELSGPAAAALSQPERDQKREQLRTAMGKLSSTQRAQLGNDGRRRMDAELARYFTLTPAEKTAYLDQQINREMQMQQQFSKGKGGAPSAAGPGGGGGGGGKAKGPSSAEDRERQRQRRLDSTSPEARAQMDVLRRDMAQRRQQRGLPASQGR